VLRRRGHIFTVTLFATGRRIGRSALRDATRHVCRRSKAAGSKDVARRRAQALACSSRRLPDHLRDRGRSSTDSCFADRA
jgi:hypothetical protein